MSTERGPRVGASVRARLKNVAKARGDDFIRVLGSYAVERLLYRLSRSEYRERFVLKGAAVFSAWSDNPHRPTRDLDLLSFGAHAPTDLVTIMAAILAGPVEDDGLTFPLEAIAAAPIKAGQRYEGVRLAMLAVLDGARIPVQVEVDIGFGDAVEPTEGPFPTLLDMPAPVLRLYPRETVIAEKFQAMVALELTNTRLKDFYDLWALGRGFAFEGDVLGRALLATFERRETTLPATAPPALTAAFSGDPIKQKLWGAFLIKSGLAAPGLDDVVAEIRAFLLPPVEALAAGDTFTHRWPPGGLWQPG